MKSFSDIYKDIKSGFKKRSNIDITDGTAIDSFILASADALSVAHQEIENSKNPHIYTKLSGTDIDKFGLLINCPRYPNESDNSYLYRCIQWTLINESCNTTAIDSALTSLEYSSNATYVPYTQGTGTATIYIIPKEYTDKIKTNAIIEIQERLLKVISPDSYVTYQICTPILVRVRLYASFDKNQDESKIKNNLMLKIKEHINSIAIGDMLSYGNINKIGVTETGINFFNATHIYTGEDEETMELLSTLNKVQIIQKKFLFDKIFWEEAVQ